MKKPVFIVLLFTILPVIMNAQTGESSFINLSVENDLFVFKGDGTDRYYTNGVRLEYFYEKAHKNFLSSLLLKVAEEKNVFSWGISQNIFTPSRIDIEGVQYDDRPYAGALFIIHSLSSFDYSRRVKVSSEINLGVIGPLSLADETQIWVHRAINDEIPRGWKNQVPNDIILNYNLEIDKEMIEIQDKIMVAGTVESYVGTMYDAMSAGFSLKIGKVKSIFEPYSGTPSGRKKHQVYLLLNPSIRVIYYNALLQGGIIRHLSHSETGYVLSKDQIERISAFTEVGMVYENPKLKVVVSQKMRTAAFKGGNAMEFGHISIGFKL